MSYLLLQPEGRGKHIASGSQDQTIRLWEVQTGECFAVLQATRLYEGINIAGVKGLTTAQKSTLKPFGAMNFSR